MASFRAIEGALEALKNHLDLQLASTLGGAVENPVVQILGTQDLKTDPAGNSLAIYLHRIAVDAWGRNRYLAPGQPGQPPRPELPVNLHLLLIGWSPSASAEATLVAWAMQQIGSALELDIAHLLGTDQRWREGDSLQLQPEEMSTEDLMRVWDSLPGDYRLSVPYVLRTLRLEPARTPVAGPPVETLVTPMEGA